MKIYYSSLKGVQKYYLRDNADDFKWYQAIHKNLGKLQKCKDFISCVNMKQFESV